MKKRILTGILVLAIIASFAILHKKASSVARRATNMRYLKKTTVLKTARGNIKSDFYSE